MSDCGEGRMVSMRLFVFAVLGRGACGRTISEFSSCGQVLEGPSRDSQTFYPADASLTVLTPPCEARCAIVGPYDFRDAENTDGIAESTHENGFLLYMRNRTEFAYILLTY